MDTLSQAQKISKTPKSNNYTCSTDIQIPNQAIDENARINVKEPK